MRNLKTAAAIGVGAAAAVYVAVFATASRLDIALSDIQHLIATILLGVPVAGLLGWAVWKKN